MGMKKSFQHMARRNAERNFDAKLLDELSFVLTNMNLDFDRETSIWDKTFTTRNKLHLPDFIIKTEWGHFIFEIDNYKTHGGFDDSITASTQQRNEDYRRANIMFRILNQQEAEILGLDIYDLFEYMVNEALQCLRAKSLN